MKKISFLLLMFICPIFVFAQSSVTFENTEKILQEEMKAYYSRESNFLYNFPKAVYGTEAPEEATKQDKKYTVCAAYVDSVYKQGIGVTLGSRKSSNCSNLYTYQMDKFPEFNYDIIGQAKTYLKDKGCNMDVSCDYDFTSSCISGGYSNNLNSSSLNNNFLIYYENTTNGIKYVKGKGDNPTISISALADIVQPGDLLAWSGHALVIYGKVMRTDSSNNQYADILVMNTGEGYANVRSRITDSDERLYMVLFNNKKRNGVDNRLLEEETELGIFNSTLGAAAPFFMSEKTTLTTTENGNTYLSCGKEECAIIRPFYSCNKDGRDVCFNYDIDETVYNNSLLRTVFPNLFIEKTVDVFDNNGVYVGDTLNYSIKISNKSSKTYGKFYIEEPIGDYVTYNSCTDCNYSSNKVKFTVNTLGANQSIELNYSVKVKNNLENVGKKIVQTGKFYTDNYSGYLTTGTVINEIIPVPANPTQTIAGCYTNNKGSKSGLSLINETYKCAYNIDFNFGSFSFDDLYTKSTSNPRVGSSKIKFNANMSDTTKRFKSMIYNNYWGGTTVLTSSGSLCISDSCKGDAYFPRYAGEDANLRAKTIYKEHFKDGDILIYRMYDNVNESSIAKMLTKENGIYAYIFLNGKFVGVNGTGDSQRNEFTYEYYNSSVLDYTLSDCESSYDKCLLYGPSNSWTLQNFSSLSANAKKKIYDFANYQSLYDKNDYVILRPSLVIKESVSASIKTLPSKLTYIQNYEELDLTGGELNVNFNDGSTAAVLMSLANVSGFDNTTLGTKEITVSYLGKTVKFNVEIVSKQVSSIRVKTLPTKLSYVQNAETLDLTGGVIEVTYNDESKDNVSMTNEGVTASGFSNTNTGIKEVTLNYLGRTVTFNVYIVEKSIQSISIKNEPLKTVYVKGSENLDLTGGVIEVKYDDNSTDEISMTNENVEASGFDNTSTGTKEITLNYNSFEVSFNVEVIEKAITSLKIKTKPTKLTYIQNYEELDLTGGVIEVSYNDNTKDEVSMTNENVSVSGFDNTSTGTKTLTVKLNGKVVSTFEVEVISKQIVSVKVKTKPKNVDQIVSKDDIDLTGGVLLVTYTDKTTDEIPLTSESVTVSKFVVESKTSRTIIFEFFGHKISMTYNISKDAIKNPKTGVFDSSTLLLIITAISLLTIFFISKKHKSL